MCNDVVTGNEINVDLPLIVNYCLKRKHCVELSIKNGLDSQLMLLSVVDISWNRLRVSAWDMWNM